MRPNQAVQRCPPVAMPLYAVYWLLSKDFTVSGDFVLAQAALSWSRRHFHAGQAVRDGAVGPLFPLQKEHTP